jgi:2,3-bisphosphoglycerate-independent phosphoglycerate mutase
VGARTALHYIEQTEAVIKEINNKYSANFRIASGGGRMSITMDRYEADWDMVKRGYECHTHGVGEQFDSAADAVAALYEKTGKDDQYLPEFVIAKQGEPIGRMRDGDAVVFTNFRGDRAMEISQAYERDSFEHFDRDAVAPHPKVFFAGMLQYDGDALIPEHYLVNPPEIDHTMGEYLVAMKVPLFAISETQKYGHVTYFWNGNRSGYLDESLETYIEIPSDNIEFNKAPAMKAREITDETIKLIESGKFRHGRINLANGDMVGHTGDLKAAIEAMEVVDECVAKLIDWIEQHHGILIYTADHGNADIMYTEKDGEKVLKTSHTLSPVPFAIVDPLYGDEYTLTPPDDAGLTNIAATVLNLLGYEAPEDYRQSLISFT